MEPQDLFARICSEYLSKTPTCHICSREIKILTYHCWPGTGVVILTTCEICTEEFIKSDKKEWTIKIPKKAFVKTLQKFDQIQSSIADSNGD